jgi:lipopolysaccharide transport system permease protein
LRWLPRLNPLTAFVQAYRGGLLSHTSPALGDLAYASAFSVTVFVVGGLIFRQLKRGFADVL